MSSRSWSLIWHLTPCSVVGNYEGGLISLCLHKENNNLRDWKNVIYSTYSPLSSTHLWLRCSNFFNPSKKNSFGCAANKKSQRLINTPTYQRCIETWCLPSSDSEDGGSMFLRNRGKHPRRHSYMKLQWEWNHDYEWWGSGHGLFYYYAFCSRG
jgi:hypothetical protein